MLRVKHNDTIKDATPYAKHGDVIKPVIEIWAKFNDTLQKVWTAVTVGVVGNFNTESAGGGFSRDRGVFSAFRLPSTQPPITAYQWDFSDTGGQLSLIGGVTGSTLTLLGPSYNNGSLPVLYSVTVWCTVTIDGVQRRTQDYSFQYKGTLA